MLSYQMLWPEQWQQWYAPQGRIDASGSGLHAYSLARFGFFIAQSASVTRAWLVAVRRYLQGAGEGEAAYLAFLARLARTLMLPGGVLALAVGAVALIAVAVAAAREALRYTLLSGVHGYDALGYKINMDWYSTLSGPNPCVADRNRCGWRDGAPVR